jgi:4-hydroxy-tetrahydrodipicolinate synthase
VQLYRTWRQDDADAQQKKLDEQRAAFAQFPMIPAMKAAIALKTGRKDWAHVRPPLVDLNVEQQQALAASLDKVGFVMPNAGALA